MVVVDRHWLEQRFGEQHIATGQELSPFCLHGLVPDTESGVIVGEVHFFKGLIKFRWVLGTYQNMLLILGWGITIYRSPDRRRNVLWHLMVGNLRLCKFDCWR